MAKISKIFSEDFRAHRAYFAMVEDSPVEGKNILCESMHGNALGGNIAAIVKKLYECSDFAGYRAFVVFAENSGHQVKAQLSRLLSLKDEQTPENGTWITGNGASVKTVLINSREYLECLATSKYLINDTSFPHCFIKRSEQVYLNTWHGTPLKYLGARVENERFSMGNVQKNFYAADILLVPNEHTEKVLRRDYYLDNFTSTRLARTGYPRNEAFFDQDVRERLRKQYGFGDRTVFAYLPTWRGGMGRVEAEEQTKKLQGFLKELDELLDEQNVRAEEGSVENSRRKPTVVYVKLHPMLQQGFDTAELKHIKSFPDDEPLYAFLQATDGLITDYSSVLFDYAVTGRKIVLFTYDEEKYTREHGLYIPIDRLPFKRAGDAVTLVELLAEEVEETSEELKRFRESFCPWDGPDVTAGLLRDMLSGEYVRYPSIPHNGKKNIMIYGGDFIRNGITVSLISLLNSLDLNRNNYLLLFEMKEGTAFERSLLEIPEEIPVIGASPVRVQTIGEYIKTKLWERCHLGCYKGLAKLYRSIGKREAAKILPGAKIDHAIHFTGYSPLYMLALLGLDCPGTIFVHNDMNGEAKKSYSMPGKLVADMYSSYSRVAVITEGLKETTEKYMKKNGFGPIEMAVVPNVFDYENVCKRAEAELEFGAETQSTHSLEEIKDILNSEDKKLVNIGRFSPEKGQLRLIDAFERAVCHEASIPYLFIIGSYGPQYGELLDRVGKSCYSDRIVVIKSLLNPYPVLKKCNLFVLSSVYEGLPLTVMEADVLKIPCIATEVGAGPKYFMREHGGRLVADSTEGIADGISSCLRGDVPALLDIDYDRMKKEAVSAFMELF